MYTLEMRDYHDEPWELQERITSPDYYEIVNWYVGKAAYTGTYWRILKSGTVIDSGRFR